MSIHQSTTSIRSRLAFVLAASLLLIGADALAGAESERKGVIASPGDTGNARMSMGAFINGLTKWDDLKTTQLRRKMEHVGLSNVNFKDVPFENAIKEIRTEVANAGGPKINFFFKGDAAKLRQAPVTLEMNKVPLIDVLRYLSMQTRTVFKVEEHAVVIMPAPPGTKY